MKKKRTLGIAILAAAALCFLVPAKAHAAELTGGPTSGFSAKRYYEICSALDENYCLDINGAQTKDGANLQLYRRNNTNAQRFLLIPAGNDQYYILNANSGKVVDIAGNSKANGANAQQYERNNTTAQKFTILPNEDGKSVRIRGVASGKFLTVGGGQAKNGADIFIYQEKKPQAPAKTSSNTGTEGEGEGSTGTGSTGEGSTGTGTGDGNTGTGENGAGTDNDDIDIKPGNDDVDPNPDGDDIGTGTDNDDIGTSSEGDDIGTDTGDSDDNLSSGDPDPNDPGNSDPSTEGGDPEQPAEEPEAPPIVEDQSWVIKETKFTLPDAGLYEIVSGLNSSFCLDIKGGSLSNSANTQIYKRNGTNAQKFYLKYVRDDRVVLTNAGSAKALDVAGNAKKDGTNVQQYGANGTSAQTFRLVPSNAGGFELVGLGSGKALDVKYAQAANASNVWIYTRNNTAAQRWNFVGTTLQVPSVAKDKAPSSVSKDSYISIVAKGNISLSVQPGRAANGSGTVLGSAGDVSKDAWVMRATDDGMYEFIHVASGLALDNRGAGMNNGNPMQIYTVNNTASQKWTLVDTGDGDASYYLINAQSGKYLDVKGGNLKAGAVVQQYAGNKTVAQKFYLRKTSAVAGNVRDRYPQACAVLDQVGWDLYKAFLWSSGSNGLRYRHCSIDSSLGTRWFANYGFTNRVGNCYVMAATFTEMARALGYTARQMTGHVGSTSGGLAPHSWVEVVKDGVTLVCDPDCRYETRGGGYMVRYGFGWNYANGKAMT